METKEDLYHQDIRGLALVFYYLCFPIIAEESIPTSARAEKKEFLSNEVNEGTDNS